MIIKDYFGIPGAELDTDTLEVSYDGKIIGDIEGCHILRYMARLAEWREDENKDVV